MRKGRPLKVWRGVDSTDESAGMGVKVWGIDPTAAGGIMSEFY
jgi:hypothetical protein